MQGHGRACAEFAGHADLSAHQFGQPPGNGKAQSGPPITVGYAVRLFELLEQHLLFLPGDSDAAVHHLETEAFERAIAPFRQHTQFNAALGSELDCIADEIAEDLPQPQRVQQQNRADIRIHVQPEIQPQILCATGIDPAHAVHDIHQACGFGAYLELAGLDLREVKNVVDDPLQGLTRLPHSLEFRADFRIDRGQADQFKESQHAVEWCAYLVTHGGKERSLGQVGRVCCFFRQ